jgi:hypothetical protein
MRGLLRKSNEPVLRFCDRCARLCEAERRSHAMREHAQIVALRYGVKLV